MLGGQGGDKQVDYDAVIRCHFDLVGILQDGSSRLVMLYEAKLGQ